MRTLIVKEDIPSRETLREIVEGLGYEVVNTVRSAEEAEDVLEREHIDLALLDIALAGDRDGIDLANELRSRHHLPFLFLSPPADEATRERASAARPAGYLSKPYSPASLHSAVQVALSYRFDEEDTSPVDSWKGAEGPPSPGLAPHLVERVKSHVHQNHSRDLSLDELAVLAGISKFHFTRRFRQATGTTPYQYVQMTRIKQAKSMLRDSTAAISKIAEDVGFNSQSQFNRAFKKMTGLTPGQYRRSCRER